MKWSKRKAWQSVNPFEAKVFKQWAGEPEFNPLAILFSRSGEVKVIRFWQAFRDYKHGSDKPLKDAESTWFEEMSRAATTAA